MNKVFTWSLKDGRKAEVVVTNCLVTLSQKVLDADGFKIETGEYSTVTIGDAYLYVAGKKIQHTHASGLNLIDRYFNGPYCKMISGLPAAFDDPALVERYEAWLAEVMEEAKTDEVKAYEAAQARVAEPETADVAEPVKADVEKEREYDLTYNEGGEGYNPYRTGSVPTYRTGRQHIGPIEPTDF